MPTPVAPASGLVQQISAAAPAPAPATAPAVAQRRDLTRALGCLTIVVAIGVAAHLKNPDLATKGKELLSKAAKATKPHQVKISVTVTGVVLALLGVGVALKRRKDEATAVEESSEAAYKEALEAAESAAERIIAKAEAAVKEVEAAAAAGLGAGVGLEDIAAVREESAVSVAAATAAINTLREEVKMRAKGCLRKRIEIIAFALLALIAAAVSLKNPNLVPRGKELLLKESKPTKPDQDKISLIVTAVVLVLLGVVQLGIGVERRKKAAISEEEQLEAERKRLEAARAAAKVSTTILLAAEAKAQGVKKIFDTAVGVAAAMAAIDVIEVRVRPRGIEEG